MSILPLDIFGKMGIIIPVNRYTNERQGNTEGSSGNRPIRHAGHNGIRGYQGDGSIQGGRADGDR